jgi:hypothetical protein
MVKLRSSGQVVIESQQCVLCTRKVDMQLT